MVRRPSLPRRAGVASIAGCCRPIAGANGMFLFGQQFTFRLKPVVQFMTWATASSLMNFIGALPYAAFIGVL